MATTRRMEPIKSVIGSAIYEAYSRSHYHIFQQLTVLGVHWRLDSSDMRRSTSAMYIGMGSRFRYGVRDLFTITALIALHLLAFMRNTDVLNLQPGGAIEAESAYSMIPRMVATLLAIALVRRYVLVKTAGRRLFCLRLTREWWPQFAAIGLVIIVTEIYVATDWFEYSPRMHVVLFSPSWAVSVCALVVGIVFPSIDIREHGIIQFGALAFIPRENVKRVECNCTSSETIIIGLINGSLNARVCIEDRDAIASALNSWIQNSREQGKDEEM